MLRFSKRYECEDIELSCFQSQKQPFSPLSVRASLQLSHIELRDGICKWTLKPVWIITIYSESRMIEDSQPPSLTHSLLKIQECRGWNAARTERVVWWQWHHVFDQEIDKGCLQIIELCQQQTQAMNIVQQSLEIDTRPMRKSMRLLLVLTVHMHWHARRWSSWAAFLNISPL